MLRLCCFLWICLFFAWIITVSSLECYVCLEKSWEECDLKVKMFNCSTIPYLQFDTCMKQYKVIVRGNHTVEEFSKICTTKEHCAKAKAMCKEHTLQCEVNCCTTNLCNRAHSTTVFTGISGLVFMSSIVIYI